ncbi:MAG: glutamine-hydrolyzing GMP synthase [Peptococcaceae bacterium]|nr:glutamine-hydrolyzing GMP synthase [Peptococcaceae bacterium]
MADKKELVLVLDFGGQYKELIASNIRGQKVYTEIHPGHISAQKVKEMAPIGIVFTGGPKSVYREGSPLADPAIFQLGIPILGICYGMQMMCFSLGGKVRPAAKGGEYGKTKTALMQNCPLFIGMNETITSLMSHLDEVVEVPAGFHIAAKTKGCKIAAVCDENRKFYGVQFHPEVKHTEQGDKLLHNFLYEICHAKGDYDIGEYIEEASMFLREKVGDNQVLLALSGGVDSSVCAALIERALPGKLTAVFVDHGLMRKKEGDEIEGIFSQRNMKFIRVNAGERFLGLLAGVTDPEQKRKIIGGEFIRVFEEEALKLGAIPFLAQGTIYPDVIESGGSAAATIKSHHNVGGLPENIGFDGVVEPLRGLFKDEVRALGRQLGLPDFLVNRQPFPGPGLAVRILGEITEEKLEVLRNADAIVREEVDKLKNRPDQYFAVLPGIRTVGVVGDERAYDYVIGVRAVTTTDFMTAEYASIPHRILGKISARISNEVAGAGRVVYDISGKPPATVEWE